MSCANRDELFRVRAGEAWRCEMEWEGFQRMRDLVLAHGGRAQPSASLALS